MSPKWTHVKGTFYIKSAIKIEPGADHAELHIRGCCSQRSLPFSVTHPDHWFLCTWVQMELGSVRLFIYPCFDLSVGGRMSGRSPVNRYCIISSYNIFIPSGCRLRHCSLPRISDLRAVGKRWFQRKKVWGSAQHSVFKTEANWVQSLARLPGSVLPSFACLQVPQWHFDETIVTFTIQQTTYMHCTHMGVWLRRIPCKILQTHQGKVVQNPPHTHFLCQCQGPSAFDKHFWWPSWKRTGKHSNPTCHF